MPRRPRIAPGGLVYHVLNRAVARLALFEKPADYAAFERVLAEAMEKHPTRLLGYIVMPNHWHLVMWPRKDGELTDFVRWLTHTHVMRWHAHFGTSGRRTFIPPAAVRRAERQTREPGGASRRMALVEPLATSPWRSNRPRDIASLASAGAGGLGATR
jgi:REP element-mobilizing transposase RayT